MAEIRKHDPDVGEGIAKLVRQHMGDVRPVQPGVQEQAAADSPETADDAEETGVSGLMNWDESGPTFQF